LLNVEAALSAQKVFARRYFYPSVNTLEHIVDQVPMPVSENISKRILCLPLYLNLSDEQIRGIIKLIIA